MSFWDMPEELAVALRFQEDPDYDGPLAVYANHWWWPSST